MLSVDANSVDLCSRRRGRMICTRNRRARHDWALSSLAPHHRTIGPSSCLGVVFGTNRHLPPMNLRPPGQKQFGGFPTRPPEQVLVFFTGVGVASGVLRTQRAPVHRSPLGHVQFGLVPNEPLGQASPIGFGLTHRPFWNRVPGGQQFGGLPVMPCGQASRLQTPFS
jgi:hypothetical protein